VLAEPGVIPGLDPLCLKLHSRCLSWNNERLLRADIPVVDAGRLSGIETTRRICQQEGGAETRIVAITASADASERHLVLREGFDDFAFSSHFKGQKSSFARRATWTCAISSASWRNAA